MEVTIHDEGELVSMSPDVTEITVEAGCCNEVKELRFVGLQHIIKITIKENCFRDTDSVLIEHCPYLKRVEFGCDSFNAHLNWKDFKSDEERLVLRDPNRSLTIRHCQTLKIIVIQAGAFVDYAGGLDISGWS